MYRIYRKIPDSFQGDFEFLSNSGSFLKNFYQFYGSFPGVSLMMREVLHVCAGLFLCIKLGPVSGTKFLPKWLKNFPMDLKNSQLLKITLFFPIYRKKSCSFPILIAENCANFSQ